MVSPIFIRLFSFPRTVYECDDIWFELQISDWIYQFPHLALIDRVQEDYEIMY